MELSQLHFSHPWWLWGGLVIPLIWTVFFLFYQPNRPQHQLENFIDRHLLPYLLVNGTEKKKSLWKALLLWSAVWLCLTLALAGPRWSFREMETYSRDQSLVILLDLSESMNGRDVKPSRLVRAKQKIEDLINLSKGVKVGLIAFAADPHMITPVTDDKETIRHLLPSLDTDLVHIQGSRLSPALDMAATMLEAEPGNNKALLVISDGGFEDAGAIATARALAQRGIVIHTMGIGSAEGAPLQDHAGNVMKKNGAPIISKLDRERLGEISTAAHGRYLEVHYSDHEESGILKELEKRADAQKELSKKNQFWDEHFYLLILPVLPVLLWWFSRGHIFAMMLILLTPAYTLQAAAIDDYFKNSAAVGKQALDDGDYEKAISTLHDPYRKGVAYYKAGNFTEAEMMFRQSSRENVAASAAYNLGNSLVQQQKLKEAVAAYEEVLKQWPEHTKAKDNLELVKKMLAEQKAEKQQKDSNSQKSDQQDNQEEDGQDQDGQDQDGQDQHGQDQDGSENQEKGGKQDSKASNKQDANKQESQQGKDQPQNTEKDEERQAESKEAEQQQGAQKENDTDADEGNEEVKEGLEVAAPKNEDSNNEDKDAKAAKSQADHDADLWLNRISNDPKTFMKNKFYLESKRNGTKAGVDPW